MSQELPYWRSSNRGGIRWWLSRVMLPTLLVISPVSVQPHATVPAVPVTAEITTVTDVSPAAGTFAGRRAGGTTTAGVSNSGRITALGVAVNGQRLFAAAGNTGLWRSSDGGVTWCQLSTAIPCADGAAKAIPVPVIAEVAVAPGHTDGSVVLAAAAYDTRNPSLAGVYRSADGGGTWQRVHDFQCNGSTQPALQVRYAPDEMNLVFASGGCTVARSTDGGLTWPSEVSPSGISSQTISYIAVGEYDPAVNHHWVYACGSGGFYFSSDNGDTWTRDTSNGNSGGSCGWGNAPHLMAAEPGQPGRVFMARYGGANSPRFFDPNQAPATECNTGNLGCGEGSLWHATFTPGSSVGVWNQLANPPTYFGDPSTTDANLSGSPSGAPFVITRAKLGGGYLLFFSDEGTIHVFNGRPPIGYNPFAGWHRLDGWDPWAYTNPGGNRRGFFIHPDPYDLAVTSDYSLTLLSAPSGCYMPQQNPLGPQWCGNTAFGSVQGRLWVANDGGVFNTDAAGTNGVWSPAQTGLSTLMPVGAAVLSRLGRPAALYSGSQDNSTFYFNADAANPDGGLPNWGVAEDNGDNAPYYTDAARTDQVTHMDYQRSRNFGIFRGFYSQYPTPINTTIAQVTIVPYPFGSGFANYRNRPVIQTMPNESPPAKADLIKIGVFALPGDFYVPRLYRTTNPGGPGGGWQVTGPILPDNTGAEQTGAVQASGGHTNPVFYVQTTSGQLLRGTSSNGVVANWTPVINTTSNGACAARSFYVDPYDPSRLFIDDPGAGGCPGGIKRSSDGGQTWQPATALQNALTNVGEYTLNCQPQKDGPNCLINDMLFVRGEPQTIYAAGITGVFVTSDGGTTWRTLINNADIPCDAAALGFDAVSALATRTLYVFCYGRGMLKIDGVRGPITNATITYASGGALSSADGLVQLDFPPHAVLSDHTIEYAHHLAPNEPLPPHYIGLQHFTLTAFDSQNQQTTQFSQTYTLTVNLDANQLAFHGLTVDAVDLYHWNGAKWVPADSCSGCIAQRVHFPLKLVKEINHFSEFALVGKVANVAPEPWPMFHREENHSGVFSASSARIRPPLGPVVRWKYKVTDAPDASRYSAYRWYSSFPIGDLDGDGKQEVVVTTPDNSRACDLCTPLPDRVIALHDDPGASPPVRAMWIYTSPVAPGNWGFDQYSAALVDADGDGKPDVIFASKDGKVRALKGTDGSLLWEYNTGYFIEAGPMIADLDGNGSPEIIVPTGCTPAPSCADSLDISSGALFVLAAHSTNGISGTLIYSQTFPYKLDSAEPAIADLDPTDGASIKHIVMGSWGGKLIVLWQQAGGNVVSQTLDIASLVSETITSTPVIRSSPLLADFGQGMTAIFGWMPDANNGPTARLSAVRLTVNTNAGTASFTPLWTHNYDDWKSSPALLPMGDGQPPRVVTGYGIGIGPNAGTGNYGSCDAVTGGIVALNVLSGTVAWSHDWASTEGNVRASTGVADVDGDGVMDVLLPAGCYGKLHAYDGATGAEKWNIQLGPRTIGSPSLGDLDGDGLPEIIAASYDGNVWALSSPRWIYMPNVLR